MNKLDNRVQKAYELGKNYETLYRSCAQCTLGALQDSFNKKDNAIFKAATGLGGGIGLLGSSGCGGYSGGVLFISQLSGRQRKDFTKMSSSATGINPIIKELHNKFIEEYGTILCKDIQKKIFGRSFNLLDKDDRAIFEKMGAHKDKCTIVVGKAAAWTAEIVIKYSEFFKLD